MNEREFEKSKKRERSDTEKCCRPTGDGTCLLPEDRTGKLEGRFRIWDSLEDLLGVHQRLLHEIA